MWLKGDKMSLFDRFRKSTNGSNKDEARAAEEKGKEAMCMDGFRAIQRTFEKLYPGQTEPLHYGVLISWKLGGKDPLDGISVYDGGEYYHFVTFGLSELYEKESDNEHYSGYGFELTVKLRKSALEDGDQELQTMAGILQSLARLTFEKGETFLPGEYIYTGQTSGMDAGERSNIVGFITRLDPAGIIETPNGWVKFVELIGVTEGELQAIMNKWLTPDQLYEALGSDLTDYQRDSLF